MKCAVVYNYYHNQFVEYYNTIGKARKAYQECIAKNDDDLESVAIWQARKWDGFWGFPEAEYINPRYFE